MPGMLQPKLQDIQAYQNESVVARISKELGIDKTQAEAVFDDVKCYLWLSSQCDGPIAPPPRIDDGWHTFIIFTQDYADFCQQFFGNFRHHRPRNPDDPSDGGIIMRRTVQAIEEKLGGFGNLSINWSFPHIHEDGSCSSDSVSCSPSTNCQSS